MAGSGSAKGASAQSRHGVRVGQCPPAQRCDVGQPREEIVGDLLAGAPVADDQHGGRPHVAQGAQQRVVAEVMDVQVGQVQWRERAHEVAVWTQSAELLTPLSDTDPPKGIAEVVMIPIVAAIVTGVHQAIGKRFYDLPVTPQKIKEALAS